MPTQQSTSNQSNFTNMKKEDENVKMDDGTNQEVSAHQAMQEAMDLDEIICRSICSVENPETRKRLAA